MKTKWDLHGKSRNIAITFFQAVEDQGLFGFKQGQGEFLPGKQNRSKGGSTGLDMGSKWQCRIGQPHQLGIQLEEKDKSC